MNESINVTRAALVRLLDAVLYPTTLTIPAIRAPRGGRTVLSVRYQRASARLVVGFAQSSAPSTQRNWRSVKDTRTS